MTNPDPARLAGWLLDAQVAWVLEELTGERFAEVVHRDVEEVLGVCATLTFRDVIGLDTVQAVARRLVEVIGGSDIVADLPPAVADALYDLPTSDGHLLGDLVDRDSVEALVVQVLAMHQLQDRAMDRLAESPLVASIATRYVTRLVGDFVQQNRERAEKLPGVSSLFSIGLGAASRVRGATDQFLGDAQARGTQFAMRRSNGAMREMIKDAPVREAAMEVWDLQAAEPIGALREYLSRDDLRDVLATVAQLVLDARGHEWVGDALDAGIEVFYERYGDHDLASLLAEVGITADLLADEALAFAPPVLEALRADGTLQRLVRARLEPFFASERVLAVLAAGTPEPA